MNVTYFNIHETPCKAYLPESGSVRFAIIAVHGFAGDKESSAIEALAERMCPEGAAVYCFDFPAHGAHPRGGEALTLGACSNALLSVAAYVADKHHVPKGIFATSFGGYMTLHCINELEAVLGGFALVLRAPAVKMAETFEERILADKSIELTRSGSIELGFERKIEVRNAFLVELKNNDVCAPTAKPMLVIHGTADDVVTPSDIDEFMALNPLATLVRIQGADHRFKGAGEIRALVDAAQDYYKLRSLSAD